jgi:ribokinase
VIVVVGSINLDLVVAVDRHPAPGETVIGGDVRELPGGKGANQAVAAARLGARVAMVGRVGGDGAGTRLRDGLAAEGVDVAHVREDRDAPTGRALIAVDAGGENTVVVSPGANGRVGGDDVEAARAMIADASVLLLQHEVPAEAVAAAIAAAGGTVVLNPAPARALAAPVDVLVPNRGELEALVGRGGDPADLARSLHGARAVVVTLGAEGAVAVEGDMVQRVAAPVVEVVDTTGAGDAFCGALAAALAEGAAVVEAARWAVRAAAVSVTRVGAQGGLPRRSDVSAAVVRGAAPRGQ